MDYLLILLIGSVEKRPRSEEATRLFFQWSRSWSWSWSRSHVSWSSEHCFSGGSQSPVNRPRKECVVFLCSWLSSNNIQFSQMFWNSWYHSSARAHSIPLHDEVGHWKYRSTPNERSKKDFIIFLIVITKRIFHIGIGKRNKLRTKLYDS